MFFFVFSSVVVSKETEIHTHTVRYTNTHRLELPKIKKENVLRFVFAEFD